MPLELRTQRDGSLRPTWYGRYGINGRLVRLNLFIKIAGTPPALRSLREEGNGAFERSRAAAQAKLDGIVEEARTKQGSARLVEKLYEIKTGEAIRSVLLANLPEEWAKIARKRKPNARYASQCQSTLKRFAVSVLQENVKTVEIAHVTRTAARSFMDAEANRGVTAKTWNDILKLLRATFKYLLPAGAINPFSDLPTRETETIFRKPYSPEELAAIVDAARNDEFIRPLLVTGICTAMRRGDCCLLQTKEVDLQRRFITVKTAKTGQTVSIPIFPMLYDELDQPPKTKNQITVSFSQNRLGCIKRTLSALHGVSKRCWLRQDFATKTNHRRRITRIKLLTNGQKSPKDEMRKILAGMSLKTWKTDKARLLALLRIL